MGEMKSWQPSTWFARVFGPSTYGIFDSFEKEEGRQAHLNGPIAAALWQGSRVVVQPSVIEQGRAARSQGEMTLYSGDPDVGSLRLVRESIYFGIS